MPQAFMDPTIDADAHGSPMDQSIRQLEAQQASDNQLLDLSSGRAPEDGQIAGGRTLNIPKTTPHHKLPGPSYNGAVTIGEPCQGGHCSLPVTPSDSNLIHNNLRSANPPPGATVNYPGTNRLGNNSLKMPGIDNYTGTESNPGPFNIKCASFQCGGDRDSNPFQYIIHPLTRKRYDVTSRKGIHLLNKYLEGM